MLFAERPERRALPNPRQATKRLVADLEHVRITDITARNHSEIGRDIGPLERPGTQRIGVSDVVSCRHVPEPHLDAEPCTVSYQLHHPVRIEDALHTDPS